MGIFDNLGGIDAPALAGFAPTDMERAEAELDAPTMPHLDGDCAHDTESTEREYADARQAATATDAVERIPGPTEARHLIIAGRFALFDCIAAVLALGAPATIAEVYIATLGFSKRNVVQLAAMLDAGTVGAVTLLCSHYFAGTSRPIWEVADRELRGTRATLPQSTNARQDSRNEVDRRPHCHNRKLGQPTQLQEHRAANALRSAGIVRLS